MSVISKQQLLSRNIFLMHPPSTIILCKMLYLYRRDDKGILRYFCGGAFLENIPLVKTQHIDGQAGYCKTLDDKDNLDISYFIHYSISLIYIYIYNRNNIINNAINISYFQFEENIIFIYFFLSLQVFNSCQCVLLL